jgi:hypothetical protein
MRVKSLHYNKYLTATLKEVQMIESTINPIHTLIWIISFFGIIVSFFFIWKYDNKRGYIILPLTYFLDVFFYNLVLHATYVLGLNILTFQQLEIWSGVVRLHSLLLLIAIIIFQPVRSKKDGRVDT